MLLKDGGEGNMGKMKLTYKEEEILQKIGEIKWIKNLKGTRIYLNKREYFFTQCRRCKENYYCNKQIPYLARLCPDCLNGRDSFQGGYLGKRFKTFQRDDFHCVYCGRGVEDGAKLQVEHLKPRAKSGKDDPDNLVTSCYECNAGKHTTLLKMRHMEKIKQRRKMKDKR